MLNRIFLIVIFNLKDFLSSPNLKKKKKKKGKQKVSIVIKCILEIRDA